ncbi:MAG: galactokinase, partial [Candidatus Dormibacteria bacterium]
AAWAPGRCTLVGEHVDYVGGLVACIAIDLGVAVALRPSPDGGWRVASGRRRVERFTPESAGDIGDRIFAAAIALRDAGVATVPVEVAVAASLPEGAGLSSSAAVICAACAAFLRLQATTMGVRLLAATALHAERDIVGVPVGPLDQRAVVEAPSGGVLILDCRDGTSSSAPWPWSDVVLVACDTGEEHDVGGDGYRRRRAQVEAGLQRLGVATCRDVESLDALPAAGLSDVEIRRVRHVVTETARTQEAVRALSDGDAMLLGSIMASSHASLRDDYEVSTPALDATVAAAEAVRDCLGGRLVGAGFGGTAVALVRRAAADECRAAMEKAAGSGARSWVIHPAAGLAVASPDVVAG